MKNENCIQSLLMLPRGTSFFADEHEVRTLRLGPPGSPLRFGQQLPPLGTPFPTGRGFAVWGLEA